MKKKLLSALIISTIVFSMQNSVSAENQWKSEGTFELTEDYNVSDDNKFPEQTGDITVKGNTHGVDGNGKIGYKTDYNSDDNPALEGKTITFEEIGSFTLTDTAEVGDNTITILDENGNTHKKDINITNDGLHNFKWSKGESVSSISENTSILNYTGDLNISKTVIKDNSVETNQKDMGGRSGGAIKWNNDVYDWDDNDDGSTTFTDVTGTTGFNLQDSLFMNNRIITESDDEDKEFSGGGLKLEGSGWENTGNTVLINNSYFISNYIDAPKTMLALGGAIGASGVHNFLIKNSYFGKNYVNATIGSGGAIYIDNLEVYDNPYTIDGSVFENNYVKSDIRNTNGLAQGGAITAYYYTAIKNSLFEGNYTEGRFNSKGGAVFFKSGDSDYDDTNINQGWNDFDFSIENTVFNNNSAKLIADMGSPSISGGAIYNDHFATTTIKNSKFTNNKAIAYGLNDDTEVNGTAKGGAIFNNKEADLTVETSTFSDNEAVATDKSEKGSAFGGSIYNESNADLTIKDSSFKNNKAIGAEAAAGGAIFNAKDANLTITAENNDVLFEDNKSGINADSLNSDGITDDGGTINLNASSGRTVYLNDRLISYEENGADGNLYINKNDGKEYNGRVLLNADMSGYKGTVNLEGGTLAAGEKLPENDGVVDIFKNAKQFNVNNPATLDISSDGRITTYNLGHINFNADLKTIVDADLENKKMDNFKAEEVQGESKIVVDAFNLLSDNMQDDLTEIQLSDDSLNDHIGLGENAHEALAKVYRYNVDYNEDDGTFSFQKAGLIQNPTPGGGGEGGGTHTTWQSFNPTVLASSVAAQAGALATMNYTLNYGMQNSDNYMKFSKAQRLALKSVNKYAATSSSNGIFSPLYSRQSLNGFWFKPYATFEKVPLKDGPRVSNITYGSLAGYDSEIQELKNGWERTFTGYIGYNGASQRFKGVDSYLNGGLLGGTISLYKGNFFNATTLSTGSMIGDSHNMYGKEDFALLMAGIANRTGYNIEINDGRVIFQPSMLIGYTFINTFDYTNSAGVRIDSDPANVMQLSPGIKLILNTDNGWQPYIGADVVWNLVNHSKVTANNVLLPEMSIKPYVQYGIGVQRQVDKNFMLFSQAMMQNGGRNGVALTVGLRWAVGFDK